MKTSVDLLKDLKSAREADGMQGDVQGPGRYGGDDHSDDNPALQRA